MKNLYYLLLTFALLIYSACSADNFVPEDTTVSLDGSGPAISPNGGDFTTSVLVSIKSENPLDKIYYTTDDGAPSITSLTYKLPFRVYTSKTIKAIAVSNGTVSDTTVVKININDDPADCKIIGVVMLPEELGTIDFSTINIFSNNLPGFAANPDPDGTFCIEGIAPAVSFDFYFTNQSLGISRSIFDNILNIFDTDRADAPSGEIYAKKISNITGTPGGTINLGNVALKKTGTLTGKAVMNGKTDQTGIDVYVPGTSYLAKTDSEGNFTIYNLPEGNYKIRIEKYNYTFTEVADIVILEEQTTTISDTQTIYFGYGTVSGSAFLLGEADHTGINILLKSIDSDLTYNITTDNAGNYFLSNIAPGSYNALLSKAGFQNSQIDTIAVAGSKNTILDSVFLKTIGGNISGKATVKGLTDHSGIMILAENKTIVKTYSVNTDTSGNFIIESMKAGTYLLRASKVGYSTKTIDNVVVEVGGNIENIVFPELTVSTGTITGKITLEGAASFEGIQVLANNTAEATLSYNTITDAQGIFILSDVKPGKYLLLISKDGYITNNSVQAEILSDEIKNCQDVILKSSSGKISGTITLESSEDFSGIDVLAINDVTPDQTYSTVTDASGRFSLGGVKAGSYKIQASKNGYNTKLTDVFSVSTGGEYSSVTLNLLVSSRSVIGKVLLEGMTDFAGIKITATNINSTSSIYSALSNSEGFYVIAGMVPGEYIVGYSRENYKSHTSASISLLADSSLTLPDVTLEKARGNISGIAKLEGKTDSSGIKAILVGTTFETTTDINGIYTFTVPSGNYPGGLRFEKVDFETTAVTETATVLTDNTYGMPTVELIATHNSVSGFIDLLGTEDNSGISVSIEGLTGFETTTDINGAYALVHVPLGAYTLAFERLNTPKVTTTLNVVPSDSIVIAKLDMIPNSSSVEGYVKLTGMTNFGNINVSITTESAATLSTLTNASGYFYIGNILSTGSHRVTFSKAGWNDATLDINDFVPLEVREIGVSPEIILVDTTAPVFTGGGIVLNNGDNFTNNTNVNITLNATEQGSGIEKMQIQLNGWPETPNWENYTASFTRDISSFLSFAGNGAYTIQIKLKDKTGNISLASSDSITLTDQLTVASGPLEGEYLHWTKAQSPYSVVGNILVDIGNTLTIDPGVEVRFAGNYYIKVKGNIIAQGTSAEPILFNPADTSIVWSGFDIETTSDVMWNNQYQWVSGNLFSYVKFKGVNMNEVGPTEPSLSMGNVIFDNCYFYSDANLGLSYGKVLISNSTFESRLQLSGYWHTINVTAYGSSFQSGVDFGDIDNGPVKFINCLINSYISQGRLVNNDYFGTFYDNCTFSNLTNILIQGTVTNSTFINCSSVVSATYSDIIYYKPLSIEYSNFIDITNFVFVKIDSVNDHYPLLSFKWNYWGLAGTQELQTTILNDLTFIEDYYEDFNKSKVDYGAWQTAEWPSAGYRGASYVGFDFTLTGNATPVTTTDLTVDFTINTTNAISSMRISDSVTDLLVKSYSVYSASTQYLFNTVNIVDNYVTIYVQLKDTNGNESGIISKKILCNIP